MSNKDKVIILRGEVMSGFKRGIGFIVNGRIGWVRFGFGDCYCIGIEFMDGFTRKYLISYSAIYHFSSRSTILLFYS